jgi:hypothetical protein
MKRLDFSLLLKNSQPFIGLLAANLFWLLSSYPATMSVDSVLVWNEVKTGDFSVTHTLAFEVYVWLLSLGGKYLFLVSTFQLALTSTVVFQYISFFCRGKYSSKVVVNLTSIIVFTPFAGANAVTLWKDIPFTLLILLGTLQLIKSELNYKTYLIGGALIGFGALFRREGFVLFFIMFSTLTVFLFFVKQGRKTIFKLAIVFLGTFLFSASLSSLSSSFVGDSKSSSWVKYAAMLHDLEWIANSDPSLLGEKDLRILNLISSGLSASRSTDCLSVNGLVYSSGFSEHFANFYSRDIPKMWFKAVNSSAANEIAKVRYCRNSAFLPVPIGSPLANGYWVDHGSLGTFEAKNPVMNIFSKLGLFWIFAWSGNGSIVAWPGIHICSLLVLVFVHVRINKASKKSYLLSILAFARLLTLLLVGVAQDYRYQYMTTLISVILLTKFATDAWFNLGKSRKSSN